MEGNSRQRLVEIIERGKEQCEDCKRLDKWCNKCSICGECNCNCLNDICGYCGTIGCTWFGDNTMH